MGDVVPGGGEHFWIKFEIKVLKRMSLSYKFQNVTILTIKIWWRNYRIWLSYPLRELLYNRKVRLIQHHTEDSFIGNEYLCFKSWDSLINLFNLVRLCTLSWICSKFLSCACFYILFIIFWNTVFSPYLDKYIFSSCL